MSTHGTQQAQGYQQIRANPKFQTLVKERSRLAWSLTALVLGLYFLYMVIVATAPGLLHTPLQEGGRITLGIPVGAAIIVFSWLMTGVYVSCANTRFDRLSQDVVKESQA